MYCSQWFLTIFTAKFPLNITFQIMDMFLCEVSIILLSIFIIMCFNGVQGVSIEFQIALSLLKVNICMYVVHTYIHVTMCIMYAYLMHVCVYASNSTCIYLCTYLCILTLHTTVNST